MFPCLDCASFPLLKHAFYCCSSLFPPAQIVICLNDLFFVFCQDGDTALFCACQNEEMKDVVLAMLKDPRLVAECLNHVNQVCDRFTLIDVG